MGQIQKSSGKYELDPVPNQKEDLKKPEKSIQFSEESSRTIHELGNVGLHGLGQISRTVQCRSCLTHIPERLIFCACGICLRPDEDNYKESKQVSML